MRILVFVISNLIMISTSAATLLPRMSCFIQAYPNAIQSTVTDSKPYIQFKQGPAILWSDGKQKSFVEKLSHPDLEDMVSQTYPKGRDVAVQPQVNDDPGRFRNTPFFQNLYGRTASEVRKNLISVRWGKSSVLFNRQNGAAAALAAVSAELAKLPADYHKYAFPSDGTFIRRNIAGTNQPSAHGYGIAIDLNTKHSNYWRYSSKNLTGHNIQFKNKIPAKIVDIFEKHGFIWGGRWYHYDTMHFEYRPELLQVECLRR